MTPIDIFRLMREIASNPDDDTLHQIYADHLEESGDEIKSRLVRGAKIEPEYRSKRGRLKYEIIYQSEHSNYYKASQLLAAYPELNLGKHIGKRMYCSQRGLRFTFRWFSLVQCYGNFRQRCVLLVERGLVRSVVIDMDTWLKCAGELMRLHPIRDVLLVDKKPKWDSKLHTPIYSECTYLDQSEIDSKLWMLLPTTPTSEGKRNFLTKKWTGARYEEINRHNALCDLRKACLTYGINQAKEYLGIA